MKNLNDILSQDESLFQQEALILEATELVSRIMEENRVSKADLARKMNKTKAYVTQCLSGSQNLTLRTLADFFTALSYQPQLGAVPVSAHSGKVIHRLYPVGTWAYEKTCPRMLVIDCAASAETDREEEFWDVA